MKTYFYTAALLLWAIASGPVRASLKDWSAYTSENFVIYTDARERQATELLEDFETFRHVVLGVTGIANKPEDHRLVIMMYSRKTEFKEIRPSEHVAGFYHHSDAGPRMVVGPGFGMDASVILFHEYVHHLMSQRMDINYPGWYMEGFAELLSATRIRRNKVTVGAIPKHRVADISHLGRISVRELIDPNYDTGSLRGGARFYATAWLFMHFLQFSPLETESPLKEQTADYLKRLNRGENPLEAFNASYGMTPEDMDGLLGRYQRKRRYTVLSTEVEAYAGGIVRRELSPAERSYLLADLAWRLDRTDIALEYLRDLENNAHGYARALALQALLENSRNNLDEADRLRSAALELGEEDSRVQSTLASMEWNNLERSGDPAFLSSTLRHSQRAAELDSMNLEAHKYQWMSHARNNEPIEAAKSMMEVYRLYPTSIEINAEIGLYLLRLKEPRLARPFIDRVHNWSHSRSQKEAFKKMLEEIDVELSRPAQP
ncbi:hypothetical protein F6455_13535 [Proteobacteria bacterium 005FR1]|nr:hypothetical protein [Proteobacteria bacterium 005FR1]